MIRYGCDCLNGMMVEREDGNYVDYEDAMAEIERLRKENSDYYYEILGIMHSVEKWLNEEDMRLTNVEKSAKVREKTLQIIEGLEKENLNLQEYLAHCKNAIKSEEVVEMMELITCDSGDWEVLRVDGEIFFEGHKIPSHVWLELLETKFAIPCKEYTISDDDMENRTFESEDGG